MKFRAGPRIALVPSAGFQVVGLKQFPGALFGGCLIQFSLLKINRAGKGNPRRLVDGRYNFPAFQKRDGAGILKESVFRI